MDIHNQTERAEIQRLADEAASTIFNVVVRPGNAHTEETRLLQDAVLPIARLLGFLQELSAKERGLDTYASDVQVRNDSADGRLEYKDDIRPRRKKPRAVPVIEEDIKSQELVVIEKAEVAVAEIKQRKPFVTAEFKCISDYDLCVSTRGARLLCALALFICIGRRVVPFVKGK